MKKYIQTALYVLIFFLLFPLHVFATDFYVKSPPDVMVGDEYVADITLNTIQNINAVEGKIVFPKDLLEFVSIKDGNSVINFWVSKPQLESNGTISFSGITPGGFTGADTFIFSVVFKAKKVGSGSVNVSNIKVLLNDGKGTEDKTVVHKTIFNVTTSLVKNPGKEVVKDTELPESFRPEIAHNPFLFDGKWFVAFATQDKNSGIQSYSVKESRQLLFTSWDEYVRRESPYVLSDQDLHSYVYVKVVDNAGNERVERISPRYPLAWYQNTSDWIIIIVSALCIFLIRKWKKRRKTE